MPNSNKQRKSTRMDASKHSKEENSSFFWRQGSSAIARDQRNHKAFEGRIAKFEK